MAHSIKYNSPSKADIALIRGDSLILTLNCLYEKQPYEFDEGDTAIFTIRRSYKESQNGKPIIQKVIDVVNNPELIIEPHDTSVLPYGNYKYDIQLNFADGVVDTVLMGTFSLEKEVT